MIKIALSGACGFMGRVIAEIASNRPDCEISVGVDITGKSYSDFPVYEKFFALPEEIEKNLDVIVDFSHPSALPDLLNFCKMKNVPVVIATTGFNDEEIQQIKATSKQIPVFFTFNMSLGINLLADLAKRAVAVLGSQFDVEIIEKHHNRKKDAPSGTAIMLAEAINEEFEKSNARKRYVYDRHNVFKPREKEEIGISAVRGGTIVGEHEIIFAGRDEVITLAHSISSREVFAVGSINAALFLAGKKSGLYDMSDLLRETI